MRLCRRVCVLRPLLRIHATHRTRQSLNHINFKTGLSSILFRVETWASGREHSSTPTHQGSLQPATPSINPLPHLLNGHPTTHLRPNAPPTRPPPLCRCCICTSTSGQHRQPPRLSAGQASLLVERVRLRPRACTGRVLWQLRRRGRHQGHQDQEGGVTCL